MTAAMTVAALALALTTGCVRATEGSGSDQNAMDAITSDIQATLAKRPDVVTAKVGYQNTLVASEQADATITISAGADFEPVIDEAVRLIWQSKLKPLSSISVGVIDEKDLQRGTRKYFRPDKEDKAELESKYGPRPK
jgi:hypothetical protein